LLRNEGNVLPLDAARAQKAIFIVAAGDDDPEQGKIFQSQIEQRVKNASIRRIDRRTTEKEYDQIFDEAKRAETIIIAPFVKRAALKGTIALPESEAEFIRKLVNLKKTVAVAAFGSPYQVRQFPEARVYMIAYAVEDVAQTAAARAIFGETAISGRSPVGLPGFFKLGDGLQLAPLKSKQKDAKEITEIPN
jgi:beta-N-acetylhexosaminidase